MQLHPEQEQEHQPQSRPQTQPKSNLNPSPNRSPIIKITDDEDQQAENAFETLVSITDKSGNLRKDLMQDILQSVSTIRKVFAKMKTQLENKCKENKKN